MISFITLSVTLAPTDWLLVAFCALLIGMSKVGIPGVSMIVVPTMALIFGGKPSTGVLLPILIMADIFGVIYYHRHAQWKHLFRALPWAVVGLLLALWIGKLVNDIQFKRLIALSVLVSVALMIWKDYIAKREYTADHWGFAALMGVVGGFATMIGNVAGPIFAIYLLAMHLDKQRFIGTTAWFFFIINLTKFPLQVWVWNNINWSSLQIDLTVLPAIALGAWMGIHLVKRIPEQGYKWMVMLITIVSSLVILL